jgi:AmmeMemoRadiSam system protein B
MVSSEQKRVRLPAVAGQFYTSDPEELERQLDFFLKQAQDSDIGGAPKAIIAPHAGYIYSGPVAATAYKTLEPIKNTIKQVVIMSPAHRHGFRGIAWSQADYFRTPLGDIPVNKEAFTQLTDLDFVMPLEQAFEGEHALEVHLPFLQMSLAEFSIVPFIVGLASAEQVAEVLNRLWGDEKTLIVISSDLSHFHEYHQAQQIDKRTSNNIESLNYEAIGGEDACGTYPLSGLLLVAKQKQLHASVLDLRNSGDTAGDKSRVVGYGAYIIN